MSWTQMGNSRLGPSRVTQMSVTASASDYGCSGNFLVSGWEVECLVLAGEGFRYHSIWFLPLGSLEGFGQRGGQTAVHSRKLFVDSRDLIAPDTNCDCRLGMSSLFMHLSYRWTHRAGSWNTKLFHYFSQWFWTWWTFHLINISVTFFAYRDTRSSASRYYGN